MEAQQYPWLEGEAISYHRMDNQNWEVEMFRQYGQGTPSTTVSLDVILNYGKSTDTSVSFSEKEINQENSNLQNENKVLKSELERKKELLENEVMKCEKLEAEIARTTRVMELMSGTVFSRQVGQNKDLTSLQRGRGGAGLPATGMEGLQPLQDGLGRDVLAGLTGLQHLLGGLGGSGLAATGMAGPQHLQAGLGGAGQAANGMAGLQPLQEGLSKPGLAATGMAGPQSLQGGLGGAGLAAPGMAGLQHLQGGHGKDGLAATGMAGPQHLRGGQGGVGPAAKGMAGLQPLQGGLGGPGMAASGMAGLQHPQGGLGGLGIAATWMAGQMQQMQQYFLKPPTTVKALAVVTRGDNESGGDVGEHPAAPAEWSVRSALLNKEMKGGGEGERSSRRIRRGKGGKGKEKNILQGTKIDFKTLHSNCQGFFSKQASIEQIIKKKSPDVYPFKKIALKGKRKISLKDNFSFSKNRDKHMGGVATIVSNHLRPFTVKVL